MSMSDYVLVDGTETAAAVADGTANKNEEESKYDSGVTVIKSSATYSSSNLYRYPSGSQGTILGNTDYVSFEFFKYKPPFSDTSGDKREQYNTSIDFSDGKHILGDKFGKNIIMYMPEDVQSEYGANWSGAGFGFLAGRLMKMAGGSFDIKALGGDVGDFARTKVVKSIVDGANKALGSGVTENQALGGITGTIINPNTEMMYESPEMRTFSLTYKMFATNERESNEIRGICNTFKKNMLPQFGGGAFVGIPNIVRVTFMTGSGPNPYVSQFKPCAITNVSINYTPDGSWASYKGGAPVATNITINFKELKMLFADDITIEGASF